MRPASLAAAAALAVVLAAAGCGEHSPPGRLDDLLEVMPADAADRGLFYTRVEAGAGFGSVLPLRRAGDLLGVDPDDLTDVLESGGAPLTVLAGRIDADAVSGAVGAHGYVIEEVGDWTVFARGGGGAGAGPLAAAVPAGAVRRGMLVLGDRADVDAAVAGEQPVGAAAGVGQVAGALGDAVAAALLTSPETIVDAAAADGGVEAALERGDARGELPAWDAAALVWGSDDDGDAVLLAYDRSVDGHEAARALVLRAATTPVLGEGRRATAELFERGAPRWDADTGVVRLPVRWREPHLAQVRRDVEGGALLFLAPAEPAEP